MKKLLVGLGVLVALVFAAALLGPSFVDWNAYKGEIAGRVKEATGRDLFIDGDIALNLLPTPRLAVSGVRLANLPGAAGRDMLRLRALNAQVSLARLLQGRIQVESLELVEPQISLERLADGRVNWQLAPAGGAAAPGASAAPAGARHRGMPSWLQLEHATISNGTLSFRDDVNERTQTLSHIDAGLSIGAAEGPFRAQGRASVGDVPLNFEATLEHLASARPAGVGLKITLTGAQLDFGGSLSEDPKGGSDLTGKLRLSGADLATTAATLGFDRDSLPGVLTQKFGLEATLDASPASVALQGLSLRLGDSQATGRVTLVPGQPDRAAVTLAVNRVDLDKWLALKPPKPAGPDLPAILAEKLAPNVAPKPEAASGAAPAELRFSLPTGLEATLDLSLDALVYRGGLVRQLRLGANLRQGELAITQLAAALPGSSDFTLYGALRTPDGQPSFSGNLEAASDNLRGLLDWLKLDASSVPAERLRKLSLASTLQLTPKQLQLRDVDVNLDSTHLVGGATILLHQRPAFGASLAVDRINLDAYLPQPAADKAATGGKPAAAGAGPGTATAALPPSWLRLLDQFDANIRARVDELIWRGQGIRGLKLDGTVQSGTLTLREAKVDDLAGLKGTVSGKLTAAAKPQLDANLDLSAPELATLLRFAQVTPPLPVERLGALGLKGHLAGALDNLSLDLDARAMGGTYRGKGTVGLMADGLRYDLDLSGKQPQLARVVRLFVVDRPVPELGTLDFSTHLKGQPGAVALSGLKAQSGLIEAAGDLAFGNLQASPAVKADLTASTKQPALVLALAGVSPPDGIGSLGPVQLALKADGDAKAGTIDSRLAFGGGALAIAGKLAKGDRGETYDLTVSADHPDLAALLRALDYSPRNPKLGALKVSFKAKGGPDRLTIGDLKGQLGPVQLGGSIDAALGGPRPKLVARLDAGAIDLDSFLPAEAPAKPARRSRGQATGALHPRWSTSPFQFAALRADDADLALNAASLSYGQYRLDGAKLAATLANGVLDLQGLTGKLYGGDFKLSGKLDATAQPKANLALRLAGSDLAQAKLKLAAIQLTKGGLSASADLAASGASEAAMVESLSGTGSLKMQDGVIQGFDLPAANQRLVNLGRPAGLLGLVQSAMSGGETKVKSVDGTFTVKNGVAENKDLKIDADGGSGSGQGTVDLPRWYMDYGIDFKLTGVPDAPPFGVKLKGAPDEPRKFLNANALQEYLMARAAGGVLKHLQKNTAPAAPQAAPAPPQAQPAPQKPESVQDVIQNLLKDLKKK